MSQISQGPVQMFDQMDKGSDIELMKSSNNNYFTHLAACDVSSSSSSGSEGGGQQLIKKVCIDCGTSKTPLWRGGPAGPKSLCNACGIRNRKRRRALLGLPPHNPSEKRLKKNIVVRSSSSNSGHEVEEEDVGDKMMGAANVNHMMKLTGLTWQRSTAQIPLRKLGEEEQAAVLLMAMAYGSTYVFA